jgi:hypothetical protein
MTPRPTEETIRQALTVPVPIEWAFATFTDLGRRWPHEYTWAAETLEAIGIEPREGRGPVPSSRPLGHPGRGRVPRLRQARRGRRRLPPGAGLPGGLAAHARPLRRRPALTEPPEQDPRSRCCKLDRSSRAWRNRQTRRV